MQGLTSSSRTLTLNLDAERSRSSDEGDAYGDAGGLCPLGRLVTYQVLHHCVFGHVLHKIGLLQEQENTPKGIEITATVILKVPLLQLVQLKLILTFVVKRIHTPPLIFNEISLGKLLLDQILLA